MESMTNQRRTVTTSAHSVPSTVDEAAARYGSSSVDQRASSTVRGLAARYASSIVVSGEIDPRIKTIDRKRAEAKLSHGELCRRAGIHAPTWLLLRKGQRPPLQRTIEKLERGLAGDDHADRVPLLAALHRLAMMWLSEESGADVETIMRQDFSVERPQNTNWLRASHLRRYAMFIVTVEIGVSNASLARALDCSRQNVQQARRFTENACEDPAIKAMLDRCARLALGRR